MAVISKNLFGKIRFADNNLKTINTYGGINPEADADDVDNFAGALETLRGKDFAHKYLITESLLEETV
jgi:hypothetical protein